jgi:hypothetical protein
MTASALIQLLQGVPPDTRVTVDVGSGTYLVVDSVQPGMVGQSTFLAIIGRIPLAAVDGQAEYQRLRGESE